MTPREEVLEAAAIRRQARIENPPLKASVRVVERGKRQTRHNQMQTAVWYEHAAPAESFENSGPL